MPPRAIALLSALLALAAQWTLVHVSYDAHWTALFCAGGQFQRPPEIAARQYVFPNSQGYDGQFYQVIAHDPLLLRHFDRYVDAPRLRYRRILVPAMAFLLAAGQPAAIDPALFAVTWAFIALGAFCLASLATGGGRSPAWGFLFLLAPATLASLERMTIDMPSCALLLAALLAAQNRRWTLLWCALAAVVLSRETGTLVVLAVVLWLGQRREVRQALVQTSSLLPAAVWYGYVQSRTSGDYTTSDFAFLSAFFASLKHPVAPNLVSKVFAAVTLLAVIALLWAAVRCLYLAGKARLQHLEHWLCLLFALLVLLFQNAAIWEEPNGFTRIYSSLLLCLLAATWKTGFRQTLALYAATVLPLALQLGVHLAGPLYRKITF